ncbi:hypothetical protein LCGC14_1816700 [marine sediment metagenome]|uniref:Uncharacterized protein n=1 Tax=marine sediment metagenome TaxID=412755 RepID=A0A0F9JJQ0_9ZZZZ
MNLTWTPAELSRFARLLREYVTPAWCDEMSPREVEVLYLTVVHDLSIAEIADVLDVRSHRTIDSYRASVSRKAGMPARELRRQMAGDWWWQAGWEAARMQAPVHLVSTSRMG